MSNALCRLATGGGLSTRKLYSDAEEAYFEACRPVIINGIGDIVTRNDLADRALIITLPTIKKENRIPERVLWPQFEEARPMILGALLTGVSAAIRNLDGVNLETYPRMADFLEWAVATAPACGWGAKAIVSAYEKNIGVASQACFEADVVALAIYELMRERQVLRETPANLLQMLAERKPEAARDKYWPKAPNQLSNRLKEAASALETKGINVKFRRSGGTRTIELGRADAKDDDL
jgi:putative DNA primase/helicase